MEITNILIQQVIENIQKSFNGHAGRPGHVGGSAPKGKIGFTFYSKEDWLKTNPGMTDEHYKNAKSKAYSQHYYKQLKAEGKVKTNKGQKQEIISLDGFKHGVISSNVDINRYTKLTYNSYKAMSKESGIVFNKMTSDERMSFTEYTGKGTYNRINRYLRGDTDKISKTDKETLDGMHSGFSKISKSVVSENIILNRGFKPQGLNDALGNKIPELKNIMDRFEKNNGLNELDFKTLQTSIGKHIEDKGFGSTSYGEVYEKRRYYTEILVNKGDKDIIPLDNVTQFKHESEVLINANSKFKIVGLKERIDPYVLPHAKEYNKAKKHLIFILQKE